MPSNAPVNSKGSYLHIYVSSSNSENHLYIAIPNPPQTTIPASPSPTSNPPASLANASGGPPPYSRSIADDVLFSKSLRGPPARAHIPTLDDRLLAQERLIADAIRTLNTLSLLMDRLTNTVDRLTGRVEDIQTFISRVMDSVIERVDEMMNTLVTRVSGLLGNCGVEDAKIESDPRENGEGRLEVEGVIPEDRNASQSSTTLRVASAFSMVEFVYDTVRCAGLNLIF